MKRLSRATALKSAAIIMVLFSIIDIVVFQIPSLIDSGAAAKAAANEGPPFFMVILAFTVDIVALVAAYGAWNKQRWGVVLLIVSATLNALPSLGGMIFAPDVTTKIIGGIGLVFAAIVIVLCLWRDGRPVAGDGTIQATN